MQTNTTEVAPLARPKTDPVMPDTMNDVPPHVLELIAQFLVGVMSQDVDLRKAHLRASMKDFLPLILVMYGLIIVLGVIGNTSILIHTCRHKLCNDPSYIFVINNALSDIVKCAVVLPISLYVLLVQNWMLGELLCSFLPMLQDIPLHVTTLTFVLTAWDRYRFIRNPNKSRMPALVCAVGTWLTALCLALPFPIYIIYVDLGNYSKSLDGIGFCVINLTDDMQEYMRALFLIMYAGPLATVAYLYVKSSRVLKSASEIMMCENRRQETRSRIDSQATSIDMRGSSRHGSEIVNYRNHPNTPRGSVRRSHDQEMDLDVGREMRTNKFLSLMATFYGICMCPLMILRVARLALLETYDNAGHFDITYTLLVWIGFLPTCTTPGLYAIWHMSRPTKERLKGYFRISYHKVQRGAETAEVACVPSASSPPSLEPSPSTRSARYHYNQLQHAQQQVVLPNYARSFQRQPEYLNRDHHDHQPIQDLCRNPFQSRETQQFEEYPMMTIRPEEYNYHQCEDMTPRGWFADYGDVSTNPD